MQLIDLFDRGATYGAESPCLIEPGGSTWSYAQVQDLSHRIANGLQTCGVERAQPNRKQRRPKPESKRRNLEQRLTKRTSNAWKYKETKRNSW